MIAPVLSHVLYDAKYVDGRALISRRMVSRSFVGFIGSVDSIADSFVGSVLGSFVSAFWSRDVVSLARVLC